MFIFGHVGIGRRLATPWRARLPPIALIVGTLLPDLIDKPLYYSRLFSIVSSTRTFGHTGLVLLILLGVAYARRSAVFAALGVGVAAHLALDFLTELSGGEGLRSLMIAITWPLMGSQFATFYLASFFHHLAGLWSSAVIWGEVVGLGIIGWEWRARRRGHGARGRATPTS